MAMFILEEPDAKIIPGGDYGTYRPRQGVWHWAIDLARANYEPALVRSPVSGTVIFAGSSTSYHPAVVVVRSDVTLPNGMAIYHIFGHMSKNNLPRTGSRVERGAPIGSYASALEIESDKNPNLTETQRKMAPHVHWEIAVGDPQKNPLEVVPKNRTRVDPATWWATGKLARQRVEKIEIRQGIPPYWAAGSLATAAALGAFLWLV